MRSFLAGLFLLLLPSIALAQSTPATGYVTALGFQSRYRPDCWTALRVHLDSTISTADEYQIQVHQLDLDKDTVVYARTVTLGPRGADANAGHEDYWAYFIPQPVGNREGGGLPGGKDELAKVLKVQLYDKAGRTFITNLAVGFSIDNLDPRRGTMGGKGIRGRKLVLCVVERDKPRWYEDYNDARGVVEDPIFLPITTAELPESVLGYEAVDAIIWFDANATDISAGGAKGLEAIRQYVQQGGQLVVCQPGEQRSSRIAALADLLPVVIEDDKPRPHDLSPLIELAAKLGKGSLPVVEKNWRSLEKSRPGWGMVRARPRADAMWDKSKEAIRWDDKPDDDPAAERSPYIARRAHELGSVVWVAHDLADPGLTAGSTAGWAHVWDQVLGWGNDTYTEQELSTYDKESNTRLQYAQGEPVDLGGSLLKGMEHTARGAAYIFLAVVFFVVYWLVAGPGGYAFLAARKRKGLSWLIYAASAMVATGLTVVVVKLVLRGSPEVRHLSIVRLTPADPAVDGSPRFHAVVTSRLGLYIPRDGDQRVELPSTTAGRVSYLIPFAVHPEHLADETGFIDRAKYAVNVDGYGTDKPISVDFPYRSTLKKLQAQWAGTTAEGIAGPVALTQQRQLVDKFGKPIPRQFTGPLIGKLTNTTGRHLNDIYIAFNLTGTDNLLYVPTWPKDATLDLDVEYNRAGTLNSDWGATSQNPRGATKPIRGILSESGWGQFWYPKLTHAMDNIRHDDHEDRFMQSFPMMAFFDRLGPQRAQQNVNSGQRWEVLRRGGRNMNMSGELAGGKLVILARGPEQAPLPFPLAVDGDKVEGEGVVLYEVAIPIDRTALNAPAAKR